MLIEPPTQLKDSRLIEQLNQFNVALYSSGMKFVYNFTLLKFDCFNSFIRNKVKLLANLNMETLLYKNKK